MRILKRLLVIVAVVSLLLIGFIILVLPGIAVDQARQWVARETGRTLQIGALQINPFGLDITAENVVLSEIDPEETFVSWDRLQVSLSLASLYHLAPVIDQLHLERPRLQLQRLDEGRFNFSDLLELGDGKDTPKEAASAAEPARFSINNLLIDKGEIELVDRHLDPPVRHHIRAIHLALPAIGNLPHMVENPVEPVLRARINEAPIELVGTAKPFRDTLELGFDLELFNIDLTEYLPYVPIELPVQVRHGLLNLDVGLLYRATADAAPQLQLDGQVNLADLHILDRTGAPIFRLPLLQADFAPSNLLAKDVHLNSVRIYNLGVHLDRDRHGVWNHARLANSEAAEPAPEASSEEAEAVPLQLRIEVFQVREGEVFFQDQLPAGGFETVVKEIRIDLTDFSLDGPAPVPFTLYLKTAREESADLSGSFLLDPFSLDLQGDLRDLAVASYLPYYQAFYARAAEGRIDLAAELKIDPDQGLLVEDGALTWRQPYLAFNESEGIGADRLEVRGIGYDLDRNRLDIATARFQVGRAEFSRARDGQWSPLTGVFPVLDNQAETSTPNQVAEASTGPPFAFRIGEVAFRDWSFEVEDRVPSTPARFQAEDFSLTLRELAVPAEVDSIVELATGFGSEGRVELQGKASLADRSIQLDMQLKRIGLETFAPYLAETTNLVLTRGDLYATLATAASFSAEPVSISYRGDIGVNRLALLDGLHRQDLVTWDSLQIGGIQGSGLPLALDINSVTLSDYYVKLLIDEEQRLNLVSAFRSPDAAAEEPAESTEPASAQDSGEAEAPGYDLNIDSLTLQGGQIDFTDRHLPEIFHADMRQVGGRISNLSSASGSRADIDLRGRLRDQSPLTIAGSMNPLVAEPYLDLTISFKDIALSPLSPYSGTYVGYLIEKGKLNLDLEYQLEDGRLVATNKLFLDQFTFGKAVESDKATSLPVKLAVALLKDRKGEIHLDIPVSGNLDDPQFSVTGVVWKIIRNLLVKAATAPFALLGALIPGGGDEDFSTIHFPHGSAQLPPPEQEKLNKMVEALKARPNLDLEIAGYVDPDQDPEGYRRVWLRQQVRRQKYLALAESGELPENATVETIEVSAEEYDDYLWEVYQQADFPKPRNFLGLLKKIPPEEQEKLLLTSLQVGEAELAALAQARAAAVRSFLVDGQGLDPARTFMTRPDIQQPPEGDDSPRSRVELDLSVN